MRILIEPGSYSCLNLGDVAMLQVAVARIRVLRPDASLSVVTRNPGVLARCCPGVRPVAESDRRRWLEGRALAGRWTWHRLPRLVKLALRCKWKLRGVAGGEPDAFLKEIERSDLLLASGMGAWTDAFGEQAAGTFDLFEIAQRRGIPTAAFGQGIGPIEDGRLWARARAVLPRLEIIGVRESRTGPALLERLGVPRSRVVVTGDDAIELAFERRAAAPGAGLGINLRVSPYSEAGSQTIKTVGTVLERAVESLRTFVVPAPISLNAPGSDAETIRRLWREESGLSGSLEPADPAELIRQIGQCRLVVSGSYHGAVLALAQGIPAVCLARSRYYADKFLGLATQFGTGCTVVVMEDGDWAGALFQAIQEGWESAGRFREELLARAAEQIEAGRGAYRRLFGLLGAAGGR
ncbi:MAG: polysaccharide pyruvyl transferase family protein [Acidobacteriota bacterium]